MSYDLLLEEEGIDSQYMAVMTLKRQVTSWTLESGSVYRSSFNYGYVSSVTVDGTQLQEGSSSALAAGEFYYDVDNEILYVRTLSGGDPSSNFVTVFFDLYIATFDKAWHRVPTNSATDFVYWEPIIARSPEVKVTMSEILFGFVPIQSSRIRINNFEHTFERILYDSSFNKGTIKIYHLLGDLEIANIRLVFNGFMQNVTYNNNVIDIKLFDRFDIFSTEYRNPDGDQSFLSIADFPSIDPKVIGSPIRKVYGLVDGVIPINIDYKQDEPTTSDNRDYVVQSGQSNIADYIATVGGGAHTNTRTYVNDATGFTTGDSVFFNRVSGTDKYFNITNVNYGSNYIEHPDLSAPMADGDSVSRSFVGSVTIIQGQQKYKPQFQRDYTSNYGLAGGAIGFSFTTSMESNISLPNTLGTGDQIFCRVYGQTNNVTLGGPALGTNDDQTGNLTNPIAIMIKLLKELGITESEIEQFSFTSIVSSANTPIGFSIPKNFREQFPTYKDIIIDILRTIIGRFFLNNDRKWEISLLSQITGAADISIDDNEILRNDFDYKFNYDEIFSEVLVQYFYRERDEDINITNAYSNVTSQSNVGKYLHEVNKQKVIDSLHIREVDAQDLADRMSDIFGEREGQLTIACKNRFFNTLSNDRIQVDRKKMPGFAFDNETVYSKKFAVMASQKSLREINFLLDDQKGIQDNNSGNW